MAVEVSAMNGVAHLRLNNPPVNAIAEGMPAALAAALQQAMADPAIVAVVLSGHGRCFSAGADIAGFEADEATAAAAARSMRALMVALDAATKPVVAALHGYAFGGGLEIAMAAHWRLAAEGTRLGLPEINLGLIPGAGGTQRLPRLVGIKAALDLMASGQPTDAPAALAMGLIDQITTADVIGAAMRFAATAAIRRTRDLAVAPDAAALEDAGRRAALRKLRRPALDAMIACVAESESLPFDAAVANEARRFDALVPSEASRGLRHAFAAQRRVSTLPGITPAAAEVTTAAVIGAGTMGTGIAIALLEAGIAVTLIEPRPEALQAGTARIRATFETHAKRGRIDAATVAGRMHRLHPKPSVADVGQADIVIEAVFEDLEVKRAVFAELGRVARPDAILATNTSTLDVNRIADAATSPERVVGLHFFSPANIMRLLEIVRADRTAPAVLARVMALSRDIGKVGVVAGVCDGFIGNRMFEEYLRQTYLLLEEGALPTQIDDAMEAWGFALGPLRVMDLAGNDIGWSVRKRRAVEQPDRPYARIADLICEQGRFGQKTAAGWYLYPDGRKPVPDPSIEALVVAQSAAAGLQRRPIADAEIVERCVLALINEGAKLLQDGIAARPLDVDQVWLHGYGFAAERGGPMFHADRLGLAHVLHRLNSLSAERAGWAFAPAPLIETLVAEGRDFGSMNA